MATTAIHVQGGPIVIPAQPHPPANMNSIKGLAITQLVIGVLTVVFGIASVSSLYTNTWTTNTAAGIWAGGWIAITGIIGVSSTRNYNSGNLNGVYMAFSIISTCASALAGLFFIVAVAFYAISGACYQDWEFNRRGRYYSIDCNYRDVGLGLHVPLLIMMIVEFFVSIIAAVFCCQNGCGRTIQTGVIVQPPPQQHVSMVTTSGGPTVMTTSAGYPVQQYQGQMAPQYAGQMAPQYAGQMAPQYAGQMAPQYAGQMAPQYAGQVAPQYAGQVPPPYGGQPQYPMQTNVVYSEKPPAYNAPQ